MWLHSNTNGIGWDEANVLLLFQLQVCELSQPRLRLNLPFKFRIGFVYTLNLLYAHILSIFPLLLISQCVPNIEFYGIWSVWIIAVCLLFDTTSFNFIYCFCRYFCNAATSFVHTSFSFELSPQFQLQQTKTTKQKWGKKCIYQHYKPAIENKHLKTSFSWKPWNKNK